MGNSQNLINEWVGVIIILNYVDNLTGFAAQAFTMWVCLKIAW